ncbi:unnamed protein product, partial [Hapterophycus canaliculatus]
KKAPGEEENSEALEGVDEILCRLAQAHPTQMPKRWELITQKLNRAMRKKRISTEPMKTIFAEEGLCIPQSWVAEKAQADKEKALARAAKAAEKVKPVSGMMTLFGKKKKADHEELKTESSAGVDDSDEAGEADTESESDDEEGSATDVGLVVEEGAESGYRYRPLSKYEVFSCMRGVHDRAGADLVATEDAVDKMESARNMVDMLYEKLPAQALKEISQQNRIKASLKQERFVYGEIHVHEFLKVMVKLKRIHGHMMSAGGSFWDLGAGVGKLVIAAAMMHNFESCYGVECLEDLRAASRPILDRWRKYEARKLDGSKSKIRVDFIFADALKQPGWMAEATLLFVNTNFSAKNLIEIRRKAGSMRVGAICVSASIAAVDDDKWGLLAVEKIITSWGSTKLYIHEKLAA